MSEDENADVTLYALSTCMWCKKTRELLDASGAKYKCIYVNELEGEDQEKAKEEVRRHNPRGSFPTIVFCDSVVVGYRPDEIEEALSRCQAKS